MQQGPFERLTQALEDRFRKHFPHCPPIRDWKGEDIVLFQEDLQEAVQGRVSEKWFYTHIKSGPNKHLPRIDILNLLSRYVGAKNWDDFCQRASVEPESKAAVLKSKPPERRWVLPVLGGIILLGVTLAFANRTNGHRLCLVDADGGKLIQATELKVERLVEGASPMLLELDSTGCVELSETQAWTLVVDGPYYHRDTIQLGTLSAPTEIEIRKDDYALMIHYFSTEKWEDWQRRRDQLSEMIADNARIFQLWEDGILGMEMYNKTEFINKMTTPINSLQNIEVIETQYAGEKIVQLRFIQRTEKP